MSKVERIKRLADAMYNRMQNLTTDTSGIRKAMDEYHQFIINEYYKEDTEKDFSIKESVIPFGASDSEMIFIPQGYHAVIEDNKVIIKKGEEPISNDLEEASVNYAATGLFLPNGKEMIDFQVEKAFKAGAQWQKQQDQSTIELAEDHAYLAGQEKVIDKACGWLGEHLMTGFWSQRIANTDHFIEKFKQAMEE